MCVCDEKSVWNVFFGNELAEVGRTKRRGSGASHFSLLCVCCLPVFLLSPMLIWSSPEKLFVWQESLSHWNEGRKLGKKKWANLRESKLTWGSSRPFDTFVVVTFIRAFWPEGVRFHTCSAVLSFFFLLLPSTLVCVAFGGQQSGRERERERMTLFSTLPALPIWISYGPLSGCGVTGLGSKPWAWEISFSPPRRKRRHQDFQQLIWERKERESRRRRTQKMEISNFITKELFNWFVIN
jgi:hypothetical protein